MSHHEQTASERISHEAGPIQLFAESQDCCSRGPRGVRDGRALDCEKQTSLSMEGDDNENNSDVVRWALTRETR